MIIGGTGGASVTGAGGMLTGYEETFFPVVVTVGTESVDTAYRENKPIRYSAFARIRNVAETAWITISDVEYFQVAAKNDGSGTTNLTVRDVAKWSIDGTDYPGLLAPSSRMLQIIMTITVAGTDYRMIIFNGQITLYSETHGQSGGAISLSAQSSSIGLNTRVPKNITRQTAYRIMFDEVMLSGLFDVGQVPIIFLDDYEIVEPAGYTNLLSLINGFSPAVVEVANRQTGGLIIAKRGADTDEKPAFTIEDDSQITLNRTWGGAGTFYNTILAAGRRDGGFVTQLVTDNTDVSKRGTIQYPWPYGRWWRDIALNVTDAENWIAEMLRGKISIGVQTNPFISVGTVIGFESSRLFIAGGRGRVGAMTIQYRNGDTSMQLSSVAVLT